MSAIERQDKKSSCSMQAIFFLKWSTYIPEFTEYKRPKCYIFHISFYHQLFYTTLILNIYWKEMQCAFKPIKYENETWNFKKKICLDHGKLLQDILVEKNLT